MATQAERLEALEKDNGILSAALEALTSTVSSMTDRLADVERILKDGEALDELKASINLLTERANKAAPLSDFEELTERVGKLEPLVDGHTEALAGDTLKAIDGELITGEATDHGDLRADLLKAFRQIEAIANHHNIGLPA